MNRTSVFTFKRVAFLFVMALICENATASVSTSIMDVSATDKSAEYLSYIFGSVTNIISGGSLPSSADSIIGAISEVLNTAMLLFTGLIVGYVSLSGLLNSANEGTPLGKLYNTMWIPLRMVIAVALVLPFAGGFSTMQIGVLWIAGHGIGIANSTTNAALDYMQATGSFYPPQINIDFEQLGKDVLTSRVCMHGINVADRRKNISDSPYDRATPSNSASVTPPASTSTLSLSSSKRVVAQTYDSEYMSSITAGAAYAGAWLDDFENGVPRYYGSNPCGSFKLTFNEIDKANRIDDVVIEFQENIIELAAELDEMLNPLAIAIVNKNVNEETAPQPDLNAFNVAVTQFKTNYLAEVNSTMSKIAQRRMEKWNGANPDAAGTGVGVRDGGWILLGGWYWDFQRINAETQKIIDVELETQGVTAEAIRVLTILEFQKDLNNYFDSMNVSSLDADGNPTVVSAMQRSSYSDDDFSLNRILDLVRIPMESALQNPDPVSGIANIGHSLIVIIEGTLITANAFDLGTKVADDVADTTGGFSGAAVRLITSAASRLASKSVALIIMAAILLLPLALLLAFYLPATPLILWIMGVAGWFVLLIEAVIAAPVWAASHAMPEGNGFVGQRALAGYMVILSLFLRPTLMVFGFFSSMLLMIVMGKVISLLFIPYMSSMASGYIAGLATFFALLAIFTALIIQTAHRAYGLINEVPDKVLRYIGGGQENLGEANNEQQSRSIFVGGAAKIGGAAQGSAQNRQPKEQDKGKGDGGGNSPSKDKINKTLS